MRDGVILLKTLLLSTSRRNVYLHTTDVQKRRKILRAMIGILCLSVILVFFCVSICIGYGRNGLIAAVPMLCALVVSLLAFVFTLLKTNGYLFNFREYDMLMSLPYEARTVAACKFLYMYIKSLPWYLLISLSMMIGYGIFARPAFATYPLWLVLSLFLPVLPMLLAAFIGFLIARVSAGFRRTNLIQTVLILVVVLGFFALRFVLDDLFRNDKLADTLKSMSSLTETAGGIYLPAEWFSDAVTSLSIPAAVLLIGVSAALFTVVFLIVGRSYRRINSALKSHAAARNYRLSAQKQRSAVRAIAFKEWKRMTGSTAYMVNCGMGVILAALVGVLTLIIGPEEILRLLTRNAPIDAAMLRPAIPFLVHLFIGMLATTVCSPSLEGKNYWILQSLPIERKTIYQGKMRFNMVLTVPFMAFSNLCLCIAGKVPVLDTVLYLSLGLALCAFSTAWGCVCGIRHMRLDWENEIEVIKQSAAVTIYLLPNLFAVMGLIVLSVFLGTRLDHKLLTLAMILVAATLAFLSARRVSQLAGGNVRGKKRTPARS